MKKLLKLLLCLPLYSVAAEGDLTVLTNQPGKQLELLLKRQFNQQVDQRTEAYNAIKSRADCEKWQRERREFFIRQIGGFPARTPLKAKTVSHLKGKGYRVENVMFESRPGHHVTANLYLPDTKGPHPGVLVPCGHSHTGKASGWYQGMSILLARHGMAALCYDPIGQGERYQSLDFEKDHETFSSVSYRLETPHPRVRFLCTVEHTLMGVGCILLGTNTAQYRIWDGMRAIDYLQSRQDIIADKIGCTGNSGGGGVFVSTSPPPYNGFTLTDFFYKKPPPTAFTPEPVRRRVAGMKQILLMIAVVALVGCGEKDDGNTGVVNPNKTSPKAVPVNIADPIVEKAIRSKLKKPTGELTEADYEKVRYLNLEDYSLTDVKGLEKLTQLKNLYLSGNELTDVKDLERLTNPSKELSLDNGSKEGTT